MVRRLGAFCLFAVLAYSFKVYWNPEESYFQIHVLGGTLVVVGVTTIVGLRMLHSERTLPEYFLGQNMRSGLSLTDTDEVVHIDMDGELPIEPVQPGTHL